MAVQNATTGNARGRNEGRGQAGGKSNRALGASSGTLSRSQSSSVTNERDENYALISVLYHSLQGAETCAQYIRDAQTAKDEELVEFFSEVKEEEEERAERAKELLVARLAGEADIEDEDEDDDEEEDDED